MAQNQAKQNNQNNILNTPVEIDPVAVVYNIESDTVENFLYNYLHDMGGLDGLHATRVHVTRDGNRNPQLAMYVFLRQDSKDLYTKMDQVPEHLRRRMDTSGFKASKKLQNVLRPIAGNNLKISYHGQKRLVYIRLDVFRVLGLLLGADHRRHELTVTEVRKLKKNRSVTTVYKSNRFVDKSTDGFDDLENIMERDARNRY